MAHDVHHPVHGMCDFSLIWRSKTIALITHSIAGPNIRNHMNDLIDFLILNIITGIIPVVEIGIPLIHIRAATTTSAVISTVPALAASVLSVGKIT
jgi:hypothetical protein